MPELCRFYGLIISMYGADHPPPHFHVQYNEHEASIDFDGNVVVGKLPARAVKLVKEWCLLHRSDLEVAWILASHRENPGKIAPLD
jgi:hypothetical protein